MKRKCKKIVAIPRQTANTTKKEQILSLLFSVFVFLLLARRITFAWTITFGSGFAIPWGRIPFSLFFIRFSFLPGHLVFVVLAIIAGLFFCRFVCIFLILTRGVVPVIGFRL